MKKTFYFNSDKNNGNGYQWSQIEECIRSATKKRDEFIEENKEIIGKIDSEDISFVVMNNTLLVMAVIKFSYYPK